MNNGLISMADYNLSEVIERIDDAHGLYYLHPEINDQDLPVHNFRN